MISQAQKLLKTVFGYDQFRQNQAEIVQDLLDGKDCFVLMPTGGGKSLCYQIPAILRPGTAIVVSPLISLMQDQVSALLNNGVKAAYYNSSLSAEAASEVLNGLQTGQWDILYVSPERLLNNYFIQRISQIPLALIAIDEAHCVSQWGHDFRPEYTRIGQLRDWFSKVPFIALTATADLATRQDIVHQLHLRAPSLHQSSFDRPNIRYSVLEKRQPLKQLTDFLTQKQVLQQKLSGLVYCTSRKRVEEVAQHLIGAGYAAKAYHAGLPAETRQQVHFDFMRDNTQIVVATVAFGMGIDKPNVRFVVHYDLPKNIEGYYQETGRAGRDGLPSEVLMLYGTQDIMTANHFLEQMQNEQQKQIEKYKLNAMVDFAEAQTCRRSVLLNYFGESHQNGCGNCDVCLNPPEFFDGTELAQKALSCVYRLGQSFGVRHVIDVLRGLEHERIKQYNHQQVSTYGIGKTHSADEWHNIFRQLIHQGYLMQDVQNHSVLKLTAQSGKLLKGQVALKLAKPRNQLIKPSRPGSKNAKTGLSEQQRKNFESLRQLRKDIADSESCPAYQVFGDASLIEMAQKLPTTDAQLLAISGVGETKLAKFGFEFLHHIRQFCAP